VTEDTIARQFGRIALILGLQACTLARRSLRWSGVKGELHALSRSKQQDRQTSTRPAGRTRLRLGRRDRAGERPSRTDIPAGGARNRRPILPAGRQRRLRRQALPAEDQVRPCDRCAQRSRHDPRPGNAKPVPVQPRLRRAHSRLDHGRRPRRRVDAGRRRVDRLASQGATCAPKVQDCRSLPWDPGADRGRLRRQRLHRDRRRRPYRR